jgi:hypothetical protein
MTQATSLELRLAYQEQREIGWDNLLMGRMSTKWFVCHSIQLHGRKKSSGTLWLSKFIGQVWFVTWKMGTPQQGEQELH